MAGGAAVDDARSMLIADDYWYFLDDALNGMVAIVTELGDVDANQSPDLPGANSA